jgi:uncharacterized membrane protein (UPF0182 family)
LSSFESQWQRWFPEDRDKGPAPKRGWTPARVFLVLAGVLVLFILLNVAKGFYSEWLWFDSLGYGSVYATILKTRLLVFFTAAIVFGILFLGNLMIAARLAPRSQPGLWPWAIVRPLQKVLRVVVIMATALLSLIFGLVAQGNWAVILRFFNGQPFGIVDPVFHKEIGFYVFSLPFMQLWRGWLLGALIITLIGCIGVYLLSYGVQRLKFDRNRKALAHIAGLAIAILCLFAWGYWLGIWELVFSSSSILFGAGYTDMHARLPAQWILLVVVLICAGVFAYSAARPNLRWPIYAVAGWVALSIVVGGIFPAVVQRFQVQPNELVREEPYIEYNIEYTRKAFALDRIEEQSFPAEPSPSADDIARNEVTIDNVRLWDPRPLKDTYNKRQSLRPYYDFNDVDIDRYTIDGEYRQVMLSARELSADKLTGEAQTWVNRKLFYTHGYGIVLSPVNEVSDQGQPNYMVKDLPPTGMAFDIEQPQLYFGEKTKDYIIVGTKTPELDYATLEETVYGKYEGEGGVSLKGFIRRLVYAWQFGDLNILISGQLSPESRVLYYRNIMERVNHLAPFLELDGDPYLVVVEGKLFWIQDAYTTSDRYPYSRPLGGINYIRNSVKAVIDAYDGRVTLYVTEPDDPLIQTYQAIFPELFVPIEQMPESLQVHLRYPEYMFWNQAVVYQTYHMREARVFYNKEDLWAIPEEVYFGNQQQPVQPYYIIMRLPDEEVEEFLLMLPFKPANKEIAIGWLAARCDGDNYGKLRAYLFPKERTVDGPSLIENRIGQDTVITEQLALWSRGGSRVIRGNLLLIPIARSYLYVEPVFLEAETGGLPELKRVIVATGNRVAMEPTLAESLAAIFGTGPPPTEPEPPPVEPGGPVAGDVAELIAAAQQHYDRAQEYLRAGDWTGYGRELDALKAVLDQLAELTAGGE